MTTATSPSPYADDDDFTRGIRVAVHKFLDRLTELRALDAVAGPPALSPVSEIVSRSGISGSQRDDLFDQFNRLAQGLTSVASAARDKSANPTRFSMDVDDEDVAEVLSQVMTAGISQIRRREVASHARTGALLLTVGALETLVAAVATALLESSPGRVAKNVLTIAQFESLGSVDAVRRFAVQQAVEVLMRKSINEWSKFFATFEVEWRQVAGEWWEFREIDARRNLVAHADSVVNETYLDLARGAGARESDLPQVGSRLDVSEEYLRRSIETLAAFGASLGVSVLLKMRPSDKSKTYRWGAGLSSQFYEGGLALASAQLAGKLLAVSRGRLERTLDLRLRHTEWFARKSLHGLESIRAEVVEFDYSGIDSRHSHLRAVLLEDYDAAIAQINALVAEGTLSRSAVKLRVTYAEMLAALGDEWLENSP